MTGWDVCCEKGSTVTGGKLSQGGHLVVKKGTTWTVQGSGVETEVGHCAFWWLTALWKQNHHRKVVIGSHLKNPLNYSVFDRLTALSTDGAFRINVAVINREMYILLHLPVKMNNFKQVIPILQETFSCPRCGDKPQRRWSVQSQVTNSTLYFSTWAGQHTVHE